jgi:hypothetical protein
MKNSSFFMLRNTVLAGLLLLLGACGEVPQPFRDTPKVTTDNPLLDMPTAVGIAVLPVHGAPQPLDTQISTALANRLQSFEIPAEAVPSNPGLGFTLEGEARASDASAQNISVVVTWSLHSRRGGTVRTYRQVVTVPANSWRDGDMVTATNLGNEAAFAIGDMIGGIAIPAQGPTETKPTAPAFPTVSVKPVDNAPGDGREALRLAVLQALTFNGIKRDDVNPDVTLTCEMIITPADANQENVGIVWHATDRSGKELGTVRLDNTIPVGTLDGPWGPTAFSIADAALNDLLRLLSTRKAALPEPQKP